VIGGAGATTSPTNVLVKAVPPRIASAAAPEGRLATREQRCQGVPALAEPGPVGPLDALLENRHRAERPASPL
jgi:hypothetical protein